MLAMTYKWTLDYIDTITWPTIKSLLAAIKEYPPADLVVPAMFKQQASPKFNAKNIPANIPYKKGKVGIVRKT